MHGASVEVHVGKCVGVWGEVRGDVGKVGCLFFHQKFYFTLTLCLKCSFWGKITSVKIF